MCTTYFLGSIGNLNKKEAFRSKYQKDSKYHKDSKCQKDQKYHKDQKYQKERKLHFPVKPGQKLKLW